MKNVKKYAKISLIWFVFLLLYLVILTLLNYFQVIKFNSISKINFVVTAIIVLILGILNGRNAQKKGYLEGLKLGGIIILILFLLNIILFRKFSLNTLIYYAIILVSSTISSMIGINLKKK